MKTIKNFLFLIIALTSTFLNAQHLYRFEKTDNYSRKFYGFKNAKGQTVIEPVYISALEFSEGLAAVSKTIIKGDNKGAQNYWGFIDSTGKEIVPFEYNLAKSFHEGYAIVAVHSTANASGLHPEKKGFIDRTGKQITPLKYDYVFDFYKGFAAVELDINGKKNCGFIDTTGKEVVPVRYRSARSFFDDTSEIVGYVDSSSQYYGFLDKLGNLSPVKYYNQVYNTINEKRICPPKYKAVNLFSYSRAMVTGNNGKAGYVDAAGKEVIPLKFDAAHDFSEGLAVVKLNGKWGCIDTTGKELIPFKYDFIRNFYSGLAAVKLSNPVEAPQWGYIDKTGKEAIPLKYDCAYSFYGEYAIVCFNGKKGFINTSGKEISPIKYDEIEEYGEYFTEGFAKVGSKEDNKVKYGFIDTNGQEIIPPRYDYSYDKGFYKGFAVVRLNGKSGCINRKGKVVVPIKYDNIQIDPYVLDGLIKITKHNDCYKYRDEYGYVDTTGKKVIPLSTDDFENFSEDFAVVTRGDLKREEPKYGYVSKTGKKIPPKYDRAFDFHEGLAAVELNDKCGYIDKTGKEIIPLKYDGARDFSEGLARVWWNKKFGFIDKKGNEVIPFKYDDVQNFSEGVAAVQLNGNWLLIDNKGETVATMVENYNYIGKFSEGLAVFKKTEPVEAYGYIDKTGKEVIKLKYDSSLLPGDFSEGLAAVYNQKVLKWGYIDKTGKVIIPFQYNEREKFKNGKALVRGYGSVSGYIDKLGVFTPINHNRDFIR